MNDTVVVNNRKSYYKIYCLGRVYFSEELPIKGINDFWVFKDNIRNFVYLMCDFVVETITEKE